MEAKHSLTPDRRPRSTTPASHPTTLTIKLERKRAALDIKKPPRPQITLK